MLPAIRTLLEAAILAPSGDNLQPWRFQVDDARREIAVSVDEHADTSPMNAGQRMSRIAVGAAVENILRTAQHNQWQLESLFDDANRALLRLVDTVDQKGEVPTILAQRVSNRRVYRDAAALDLAKLNAVEKCVPTLEGLQIAWVRERSKLNHLADIVAQADMAMFGIRAVRKSFAENIDFRAKPREIPSRKLSVESLEVSGFERRALQWLPLVPDTMLRLMNGLKPLGQHSRELVNSAQGLFVVLADNRLAGTDTSVGRTLQSAWVELTANGFAVQPMMSLPVLDNMAEHGWTQATVPQGLQNTFVNRLSGNSNDVPRQRIAALLRFGQSNPPSGRVGRQSLDAFLPAGVRKFQLLNEKGRRSSERRP